MAEHGDRRATEGDAIGERRTDGAGDKDSMERSRLILFEEEGWNPGGEKAAGMSRSGEESIEEEDHGEERTA